MDERFPDEFVTWHHKTPMGIKVDEVFGMDSKDGKVWIELAKQIYAEQGEPFYRIINHFENGAPFLEGYPGRISVTHASHLFIVAALPKTPEINLDSFNPRAAMGIDAESLDREQVLRVRDKFLSEKEKDFISNEDVTSNIIAWTSKEALYKAALYPGMDFKNNLRLKKLPEICKNPEIKSFDSFGEAEIYFPEHSDISSQDFKLFSYESYGCCVTIAFSPKCAKFGKN